ncbi:AAA domain-containing protein, putative AbiEii toxin, Type IV TA system [Stigmatella aurantiaca]|uniref:AAA domain-containing protein, putative AbiEii toxin, Type IV TA system n=1 Tax=Stigmatella aurantiaca TaxID=41 RepID=A0A1H7M533_STIAU|nr:AAA family ATPase [Stigmatella aurantiaca]SEL06356.1 AAA domain-containing protein, putative AbiEii toxin, Type IV TA system [Stigmatella aurantiaca]
MPKLTKLSINTFRNVVPTTLEFRPGINIVLGKNATGKTTLLRLLSTITGAPDVALQDDLLDVKYCILGDSLSFDHQIIRTRNTEPTLDPELNQLLRETFTSIHPIDSFTFEKNGAVVFRANVHPTEITIEKEERQSIIRRTDRLEPLTALWLAIARMHKDAPGDALTSAISQEIFSASSLGGGRMDESLEYWNNLLGLNLTMEGDHTQSTLASWDHPSSFRRLSDSLPLKGNKLSFPVAFLDVATRILGYDSATAHFDVEHLRPGTGQQAIRLSNLRFFFKSAGEEFSHAFLSYGQKRLLSFFAYADTWKTMLIADELVNGLHHEWISACLTEIGDRQAFLTSQNPLLLDFLRFESADEVRRAFILCERTSNEAGAQLVWRNPSEEEADSFFSAYQTGIQRVSDILFTKGLW